MAGVTSRQDDGAPTIEDVWRDRSAPTAFPHFLCTGARTAACFFSAAFYGRNDVIYLHQLGVPELVLVDRDRAKLAVMAKIYPTVTETLVDDAYEVAGRLRRQSRAFDIVVCDPFSNQTLSVFRDYFEVFAALARKCWITGVSPDEFDQAGIEPTEHGVQTWLDRSGHRDWYVAWLAVRNQSTGLAWLGLCRRPGP